MVDMALISSFLYSVAAVTLTIAAIYYVILSRNGEKERRDSNKVREAELLWSIYKRWSEPDFLRAWNEVSSWEWKDYDDYMRKYGPGSNPEDEIKRGTLGTYFESIGVLVKRGLIDVSAIDDMMSGYVLGYWRKFESVMIEFRRRHNKPEAAEHIEYLYNEV
jgi:hypothetical protein